MKIFDTHCDTISAVLDSGETLYDNTRHIDLKRIKAYEQYTQFFAAFIDPAYYSDPQKRCMDIIYKFYQEMERNQHLISFCRSGAEYIQTLKNKNAAAFLSIEGGECITDIQALERFYELGVRCIALTWNHTNHIASGVGDSSPQYGLTAFGKEVVRYMNRLGILIDVSHLHEKAFWDVLRVSDAPVIATHSNARAVCSHKRNLSDEQFRAVIQCGGCVGLNFYPPFLDDSGQADIMSIARHAAHFAELGGEKHIGFGADLDGVSSLPEGFYSCADYPEVEETFLHYGMDENFIFDIEYRNFERFLCENL